MAKNERVLLNIIFSFLIILLIVIIHWQYQSIEFVDLKMATYMGVAVNLFCIISNIIIERKFTAPYTIFQIFSLIFLYGILICENIFNFKPSDIFDLSILVTEENEISACFLIMYSQLSLHLGVMIEKLLTKKQGEIDNKKEINRETEKKVLRITGYILITISFLPAIYNYIINLKAAIIYGYSGLSQNWTYGFSSIFDKIVPFFQISLFSLMVGYKDKKNVSKFILLFIIVFYGSQMFFGNRGIPLIAVVTGIWLYNIAVSKIKSKIVIICLILILPLSILINVIREVRVDSGLKDWISNIGEIAKDSVSENNPILESIYEMGTAIYPTAYTVKVIPSEVDYKYGKNYLLSILSVVYINISDSKSSLANEMNIAAEMSKLSGAPFGGSYVQEAYANFGWFSVIFFFIIGILLEKVSRKVENRENLISIVLIAYFLNPFLWVVRNVMITLPRELVWYILPTYLLYKLIMNGEKKKERSESVEK